MTFNFRPVCDREPREGGHVLFNAVLVAGRIVADKIQVL
jgi:hypothetical protein